jgi:Putative Flp pilus-assembly TadE/G-like
MRLLNWLERRTHSERGQIAAFVVAILVVLFGFLALATDVGFWYLDHRVAQNEADAAALAAVQDLPGTQDEIGPGDRDVAGTALQYLSVNGGDSVSFCTPENSPDYDFFDRGVAFKESGVDHDTYDRVRVCVRRDSHVLFSSLLGLTHITTGAFAAARAEGIDDPWASLADPCTGASAGLCSADNCRTFDPDNPEPGTYCSTTFTHTLYMPHDVDGLYVFTGDVTIDADVYLAPHSDYVFMGNVSVIHGQLFGDDVFLYLTCNPTPCQNQKAGRLSVSDNAELRLGGGEIVIWVDRRSQGSGSCASAAGANILTEDNAYFTVDGGIYDLTGTVYFDGGGVKTVTGDVVANQFCPVDDDVNVLGDIVTGTGSAGLIE